MFQLLFHALKVDNNMNNEIVDENLGLHCKAQKIETLELLRLSGLISQQLNVPSINVPTIKVLF